MPNPISFEMLRCPLCGGGLQANFICSACQHQFSVQENIPLLLDADTQRKIAVAKNSDGENGFKNFFKRWPKTYRFLTLLVAPVLFTGLNGKRFFAEAALEEKMLNIGSGPTRLHERVLNVDIFPFTNVDIVASAENLPFQAEIFDRISTDQVLEHVADPKKMIAELVRVTKIGGRIHLSVPFMFPLHASPSDYSRWTIPGLTELFQGHELVESGIFLGPTSGVLAVLSAWLALVFSFGFRPLRKALHYFFMILLSPFKLLDYIFIHFPGAEEMAAGVYVVVRKN